jgi:hypothetical protein
MEPPLAAILLNKSEGPAISGAWRELLISSRHDPFTEILQLSERKSYSY